VNKINTVTLNARYPPRTPYRIRGNNLIGATPDVTHI